MEGVQDILNWMTGDDLFTHQLPRASDEAMSSLREQFPDLAAIEVPEFRGDTREEHEAKLTKALRQGTSYGPGNLAVFDWGEPEDYCYGTVDEDGVERIYHRPDCPHQERP